MTDSVVVDFQHEPEFSKKENGELPRIELIREQVAGFVDGYTTAKGQGPTATAHRAADLRPQALRAPDLGPNAEAASG